jgi:hypothetical protein
LARITKIKEQPYDIDRDKNHHINDDQASHHITKGEFTTDI